MMRPSSSSESYQSRNDRRDNGSRIPVRAPRQEWVPRGSAPLITNPTLNPYPNNPNGVDEGRRRVNHHHVRQNYVPRPPDPTKEIENLPQLVQEIQEKLTKGTVECMICYDMVRRSAAIWSCSSCYSIFHLSCIKKWARAPTSIDLSAERNQGLNWRCPGCQSVQLVSSKEIRYICFCRKRPDPPSDLYLTPHSCGEPCGKPLERDAMGGDGDDDNSVCHHMCVLQCHPGPCPPCKSFAPPRSCPCGKKTIMRRCSDRKTPITCGQRCDKILECGRHWCDKICHTGACDPCRVPISATCFCKKKMEIVYCGEISVKGEVEVIDGVFSCNLVCDKTLSCGNHICRENCHPGHCGECELMPRKIKTCYCGKTELQNERESCLDPIPTCPQVCGKLLRCGNHRCKDVCHGGDCAPCRILVDQKCRCRSSSRTVECYKTLEENDRFVCEKPCGRKKNCGRHRCSERCCPLSSSNNSFSGDWDPHLCSMVCGKKLRCGQHSCGSLCHSGHCPPCLETIFSDLTCSCGKTSIPPPLPCGTAPPSCQHPCSAPQPCGHSSSHACHFGACPPCSVPVAKECIGGHIVMRNIPCGSKDIRCNQLCGKTRQCGMHACARTCHPPPCDSSSGSSSSGGFSSGSKVSCGQMCGAPRRDCRHTCMAPCHPSALCPDLRCGFPVAITCSCGRITATVPCDAGGSTHVDAIFEASVIQKLPVPLQPVEANCKKMHLGQRKLACDEECAKMERKRVLADAFDIAPPSLDALHFGENSNASDLLTDLFRREPKWVFAIEERFKFLVLGKSKGSTAAHGLRVHVFSAVPKEKRDAIRQIAERWKLSVQAAGWEPKRFLVVHVTPKSKAPARILAPKGVVPLNGVQPPVFDPSMDMDPRLVVALLDLPRDADISALVLRFGGECELVWLNDKNALAVFSDPARAATALRRLDHGSAYHGAVVILQNGGASGLSGINAWGGGAKEMNNNPWKKAVVQESTWTEDSWGGDGDWPSGVADAAMPVWKGKEESPPIAASRNRYDLLDPDSVPNQDPSNLIEEASISESGLGDSFTAGNGVNVSQEEIVEVADDWEETCQ